MGKVRRPYPEEFKRQMVELVRAGKTPEELSREFGRLHSRSILGSVSTSVTPARGTTAD